MTVSPHPLAELPTRIVDPIDLFICGASFEDRCLSISDHLPEHLIRHAIVLHNETYDAEIARNSARLEKSWGSKCEVLRVSSDDPLRSFDNMLERMTLTEQGPHHVLIDISTVTHETVMMLFQVASLCFRKGDKVAFVYATADDYSIGHEKPNKWLSKGVKEIRSVVGFPGRLAPSKNNHLIVLLGFEEYRALSVIRELEPSLISVGYGDRAEESTGPHQETNEKKLQRLRSLVGDVNEFVFSCYDSLSAKATLAGLVESNPGYNHVVAPMNTKLSTLGAARLAMDNDAVQLCYAQPTNYNTKEYSKAGTHFYIINCDDLEL